MRKYMSHSVESRLQNNVMYDNKQREKARTDTKCLFITSNMKTFSSEYDKYLIIIDKSNR